MHEVDPKQRGGNEDKGQKYVFPQIQNRTIRGCIELKFTWEDISPAFPHGPERGIRLVSRVIQPSLMHAKTPKLSVQHVIRTHCE